MGWRMANRWRGAAAGSVLLLVLATGAACAKPGAPSLGTTVVSAPPAPSASATGAGEVNLTAGDVNLQAAEDEADRLIALAPVPPTAVEIPVSQATLTGPAIGPQAGDPLVKRGRIWRVDLSYDAALAWVRAHPPAGMTRSFTGSGNGPGYREEGLGYLGPPSAGWQSTLLAVSVGTVTADTSEIRVDAQVLWLDPTPVRDTRLGVRLRVKVASGCPGSDRGVVGVTKTGIDLAVRLVPTNVPTTALICNYTGSNPPVGFALLSSTRLDASSASRLAERISEIPLGHTNGVTRGCPADTGEATLVVLSFPGRDDVDLWSAGGCPVVSNGVILADGTLPSS